MAARSSAEIALAAEVEGTAYRYVKQLAGGAMGEVVLVEHVELGERRVMKLLRSNLADVEELALRMRTEARVLTKLDNPHVVRVHDFGRTRAGRPFMVMEALSGCTLKDLVKLEGPRPVEDAVEITRQILEGLEHVHRLGIVHRDMKPDNVFYCRSPQASADAGVHVKILDFGIVRVVEDEARAKLGHLPPTAEGMLVGTPAYLAPEQAIGLRVGPSADLYSTGAILWFLLVGRPPFQAESQYDLLRAHVMDPPPPPSEKVSEQSRSAVERLDAFVLRALEKKPEDRFSTAAEMLTVLEQVALAGVWVADPSSADVESTVRGLPLVAMPSRAALRPTLRMSEEEAAASAWLSDPSSASSSPSPTSPTRSSSSSSSSSSTPSSALLFWGKVGLALLALLAVSLVIVILLQRMQP